MDVLLQRHEAKRIFPMPEGLKELTSDIIREVLRSQPECIHTFIADYLETMLLVRERARDSADVVVDIFRQGYFFDDLYRTKKVTREEANAFATLIQAGWKGYVVRKKLRAYLQKRRRIQEEKERRKAMKIGDFLESIGITYDEATRAACVIQAAFREARRGRWTVNEDGEEVRIEGEDLPLGQRVREGDRARGRYDRWEKKDWGEFFRLDEEGEIEFDWPRVGQFFRIPRKDVRPDMEVVQFFAARDLQGKEQYSYMKEPQKGRDPRGYPIGFLVPVLRENIPESAAEVTFARATGSLRMGNYTYVFEKKIESEDLTRFVDVLADRRAAIGRARTFPEETHGELDYDPEWVVPRVMIQIRKDCLLDEDDEVMFVNEAAAPLTNGVYTFRAENVDVSLRVIEFVLKSNCATVEEAMVDAGNLKEYRYRSVGRFLAVEDFVDPRYIQKVIILPETETGAAESDDADRFAYVFVARKYRWRTRAPVPENPIQIPMARFQGHRSDYLGSSGPDKTVFVMGPMLHSSDGRPFLCDSRFWDEVGPECWYRLLCDIAAKKIARLGEAEEGGGEEEQEKEEEVSLGDSVEEDDEEKGEEEEKEVGEERFQVSESEQAKVRAEAEEVTAATLQPDEKEQEAEQQQQPPPPPPAEVMQEEATEPEQPRNGKENPEEEERAEEQGEKEQVEQT